MPKKKVQKVHVNITIDEDLNEWLDKMAERLRMNKSQLINNLISMGQDDVNLLDKMGVLGLRDMARKFKEGFVEKKGKGLAIQAGE